MESKDVVKNQASREEVGDAFDLDPFSVVSRLCDTEQVIQSLFIFLLSKISQMIPALLTFQSCHEGCKKENVWKGFAYSNCCANSNSIRLNTQGTLAQ